MATERSDVKRRSRVTSFAIAGLLALGCGVATLVPATAATPQVAARQKVWVRDCQGASFTVKPRVFVISCAN